MLKLNLLIARIVSDTTNKVDPRASDIVNDLGCSVKRPMKVIPLITKMAAI